MTTGCQLQTLARNKVAHIQRCVDCQCLSLHLGPVTVRLDDESLEALWSALGDALALSLAASHAQPRIHAS